MGHNINNCLEIFFTSLTELFSHASNNIFKHDETSGSGDSVLSLSCEDLALRFFDCVVLLQKWHKRARFFFSFTKRSVHLEHFFSTNGSVFQKSSGWVGKKCFKRVSLRMIVSLSLSMPSAKHRIALAFGPSMIQSSQLNTPCESVSSP